MLQFAIEKQGGKFLVVDSNGTVYGRYDAKADADAALEGWRQYYAEEPNATTAD